MTIIVGVSRPKTTGAGTTKSGRKAYRGKRKHWYVYYYDDDGKFRKRRISPVEVPFYGSQIRRRKSFLCPKCGNKFRAWRAQCPKCSTIANRLERGAKPGPNQTKLSIRQVFPDEVVDVDER